ncbi:hypothetical protein RRG08_014042 [Elysia crispata]|uniref:Uncharacterized protein n=1 Tax=Elysia crispata TaxID=231223 RepID=A0AAE0ZZH1_9GAST|nr:hypothetical protein RRG08_014042 [Elysia crispata]
MMNHRRQTFQKVYNAKAQQHRDSPDSPSPACRASQRQDVYLHRDKVTKHSSWGPRVVLARGAFHPYNSGRLARLPCSSIGGHFRGSLKGSSSGNPGARGRPSLASVGRTRGDLSRPEIIQAALKLAGEIERPGRDEGCDYKELCEVKRETREAYSTEPCGTGTSKTYDLGDLSSRAGDVEPRSPLRRTTAALTGMTLAKSAPKENVFGGHHEIVNSKKSSRRDVHDQVLPLPPDRAQDVTSTTRSSPSLIEPKMSRDKPLSSDWWRRVAAALHSFISSWLFFHRQISLASARGSQPEPQTGSSLALP